MLFSILFNAACKKHKVEEPDPIPDITTTQGVFVINEGNFQLSNGTIGFYSYDDAVYTDDLFGTANSRPLGDVVQSMIILGDKAYIVVNNSSRIEIVNLSNFTSTGVIQPLSSPRYILPVSSSKAYVTDLYSNSIALVDISALSFIGSIPCKGSAEEMIFAGSKIYVTNTRREYLYLVDPLADLIIDSVHIGYGSNSLQLDRFGKIWVMCSGDYLQSINASLYCIDTLTRTVEHSFDLGSVLNIWDRLRLNGTRDTLYYTNNGLWQMSCQAADIPSAPLVVQGSKTFHGLGVDPVRNIIFVADAIDYVQKGNVFMYSSGGALIGSFQAGLIPADFCFK